MMRLIAIPALLILNPAQGSRIAHPNAEWLARAGQSRGKKRSRNQTGAYLHHKTVLGLSVKIGRMEFEPVDQIATLTSFLIFIWVSDIHIGTESGP